MRMQHPPDLLHGYPGETPIDLGPGYFRCMGRNRGVADRSVLFVYVSP